MFPYPFLVFFIRRPKVVHTLEKKLKTISDIEAEKRTLITNVEADICCYSAVLDEVNEIRMQPTLDSFLFPRSRMFQIYGTEL
jgi:hypothetical protein